MSTTRVATARARTRLQLHAYNETANGGKGCWLVACPQLELQLHVLQPAINYKRCNATAICVGSISYFYFYFPFFINNKNNF